MLDLVLVALAQVAAGAPADPAAQPQTAPAAQTAPAEQPAEQPRRRRCSREAPETGSRVGSRRVCRDGGAEELNRQEVQHVLDTVGFDPGEVVSSEYGGGDE